MTNYLDINEIFKFGICFQGSELINLISKCCHMVNIVYSELLHKKISMGYAFVIKENICS